MGMEFDDTKRNVQNMYRLLLPDRMSKEYPAETLTIQEYRKRKRQEALEIHKCRSDPGFINKVSMCPRQSALIPERYLKRGRD